ncbi:hypothetical protein TB1_037630 [Malus domestica]
MDSLCCDSMAERRFSIGYVVAPKKQQSFIQESLVDLAKSRDIDLVRIDTERSLVTEQMADLEDHRLFQKIPKRKQAARKLAPSKSRSARYFPASAWTLLTDYTHRHLSQRKALSA